ncbi:MAG: helicase [Prevotella sp.]|nr:helicase [Prevotella sp.]
MNRKIRINGEAVAASQVGALVIELFLNDNYRFRRNVLNGKVEFMTLPESEGASWRPLTPEALNSIILKAERENIMEKGSPSAKIKMYVQSEEVPVFNPVAEFFESLPQWDGRNHVASVFSRIPGLSTEQHSFLAIWIRSMVAHWLQMDMLHGNECVPTLIGEQGCGKTTFVRRLLPPQLREYYLDHLNLSNKFDKDMALTNNLLVNLDELEAIRPSQHAALKQTLSKSKVNGRPIFGRTQEDRPRFASFVATTNNPHPLTDPTGSRRYICLTIPEGQLIDNDGTIDYGQLYAQVIHELRVVEAPYWFNNLEVQRIQQLNQNYMEEKDIAEILNACIRKPEEGEASQAMDCKQLLELVQKEYPLVANTRSTKIHIGLAMKEFGYELTKRGNRPYYKVVPIAKSAA